MERFEVIVIGAGPAGSLAARDLASAGARVALVDGSHPREKPCGGGLTGRALELVRSALPARAVGRRIDEVRFEAGRRTARVALPDGYLEVFSRTTLDLALMDAARTAGAEVVTTRASGIERDGQLWRVRLADRRTLSGSWLVGADGPGGMVRKQVTRPFDRAQLSIAAGSYVDGSDVSEIVIRFVDDPPGYLWSFPRPGHLAVGTCAQADVTTTAAMHAVTDTWLDAYAPASGHPRRRYAWPIPSLTASALDAEQPSGANWLLLGDAAGLVDPITREGIFFALQSGLFAARALATRDPSHHYGEAIRDDVHDELRRAARLKAGFFHPRFTSLLIDALEQSAPIRDVMIDLVAGRQSYRGLKRRLLGTLELGLALRALR